MRKLSMNSPNMIEQNIEQLAQLFPNVVTEAVGENGEIKQAIDFDLLKQELSDVVVEGDKERYQLTWPGKNEAILNANTPIDKTLRPAKEDSVDWDNTQNLYIEGDNLEVLKLLQESYLNKVQCIYIDPPYNTGNDFVYKDNYSEHRSEYFEESGQTDEHGNRLIYNVESNGRFHSDWLTMMYARLKTARNILSQDGVIFMSIDDSELVNLKKICDDIFGAANFIASITRNTNSSKNQSLFVSVSHDYCLIYAKDINRLTEKHKVSKWSVPKNNVAEYKKKIEELKKLGVSAEEITEELKNLTKYPRFIDFVNYWYVDERGVYRKGDLGGVKNGNMEPLFNPLTKKSDPVPPGGYRYNSNRLKELVREHRIHFHTDGSLPTIKRYLDENQTQRPKSIMSDDQRPDYSLLKEFNTPFDNPKQLSFMKRVISIVDSSSIIVDFFSGSSSTAHAAMQLNADDDGSRKYIMVQLPEETNEKSEAYRAGYKNICEIGKERIRRAAKKIKEETNADIDYGFRVYRVDSSNMKDVFYTPDKLRQGDLLENISNIKEDRSGEDLLAQVMLELGLELSLPLETSVIEGKTVYKVAGNSLVACFEDHISESVIKQIASEQPLRVVFRDSSFQDDSARINVEELFKLLSPSTDIQVL